jgi:cytochrome c peroxidase
MKAVAAAFLVLWAGVSNAQTPQFTDEEKAKILAHGPWPAPYARDPSNRVSGKAEAVALGERLFFEPRLSGTGSVLCATCHVPFRGFQDNRPRGFGLEEGERNTPTLLNVRFARSYGWDSANDSLWAQSIRPLLDPREMRSGAKTVADFLRKDSRGYEKAFGREIPQDDEEVLVDVAKALAAYQETLVSAPTPFDEFRDALGKNDVPSMQKYPAAAQRGLKIFVGKGNCDACHSGPLFTNGHGGKLKASPFNLLGRYNDDPERGSATGTRQVEAQQRNLGEYRVPGLRNVARTAPYMHNGSLATLRDAVESHPTPNRLSQSEASDLVSFLELLTDEVR